MTYQEILANARTCIGPYCKACPQCNGKACGAQMPGPGAKGVGDTAIRNYDAWKKIRINLDTISENVVPDTSMDFFGHTMKYPFFAGPVGAVKLHYGDKLDDVAYNDILVSACADAGIAAFTGDGTNPAVMEAACAAIKAKDGFGIPTVKPWDVNTLKVKSRLNSIWSGLPDVSRWPWILTQRDFPSCRICSRPQAARQSRNWHRSSARQESPLSSRES